MGLESCVNFRQRQQSRSVLHIPVSKAFQLLFPSRLLHSIEYIFLRALQLAPVNLSVCVYFKPWWMWFLMNGLPSSRAFALSTTHGLRWNLNCLVSRWFRRLCGSGTNRKCTIPRPPYVRVVSKAGLDLLAWKWPFGPLSSSDFFFLFKCKFYRRVGLVSGVQQNESALHTPVYPSFSRCFPTQAITEQMCCLHLWLALGTACPLQAQHCPPRLSPSLGTLTQWPWKGDLERVEVGGHFPHDIHLCRTVRLERMFWKPELLLNYLYLL